MTGTSEEVEGEAAVAYLKRYFLYLAWMKN